MTDERTRVVGLLRAWLAGTPMSELPEDAEKLIRHECGEVVTGLVRTLTDTGKTIHNQGDEWLDRVGRTDFMRGYYLGVGRGLQMGSTAVGHCLNWVTRRGLK